MVTPSTTSRISGAVTSATTARKSGTPSISVRGRTPNYLRLSGDMATDTGDRLLLSGDMADTGDRLLLSGAITTTPSTTNRIA